MSLIEMRVREDISTKVAELRAFEDVDAILMGVALKLKGKLDDYPPSRSVPGRYSLKTHRPMGYYKRGTGWMSPIVRNGRAVSYKNYRATSETLGRKWTVARRGPGAVAVGNNVSYGPDVMSRVAVGGRGPQSTLMRAYGWRTVEDYAEAEEAGLQRELDAKLQSKFGG